MEDFDFETSLRSLLPKEPGFQIEKHNVGDNNESFSATLRFPFRSKDEFLEWKAKLEICTSTNWGVRSTVPNSSSTFSEYYVCHHSAFNKSAERKFDNICNKNTSCKAKMRCRIKNVTTDTWKKDQYVKRGLPCVLVLEWCHNLRIHSAEAYSHRRTNDEIKTTFFSYFQNGLNVKAAHEFHCSKLKKRADFTQTMFANSALNPKLSALSRWYNEWRQTNLGGRSQASVVSMLETKKSLYAETGISLELVEEPFGVVVVTELMRRVAALPQASEVCFMDSTSCCDDGNHSITFRLCATTFGALPLCVIITGSQSQSSYTAALKTFKGILGADGFCGNEGPKIFMTDDSAAEKAALKEVWPSSDQKLCQFHVLQALWRWLWDYSNHKVKKEDRKELMNLFRKIMYATTEEEMHESFEACISSAVSSKYPNFKKHLAKLFDRKVEWALAHHLSESSFRGNHTNNFCEAAVRIYKDVVLARCKAYNAVALVDFTCTELKEHYTKRLKNFANSRNSQQQHLFQSLLQRSSYIKSADEIQVIDVSTYRVPSEQKKEVFYDIDASIGLCTCLDGACGRFCKHQAAVLKYFDKCLPNKPKITADDRYDTAVIAFGKNVASQEFYADLKGSKPDKFLASCLASCSTSMQVDSMDTTGVQDDEQETANSEEESESEEDDDQQFHEDCYALVDEFAAILKEKIGKSQKEVGLQTGLKRMLKRVRRAETTSALSSFLHTQGTSIPLKFHSNSTIKTQPTSRSRRSNSITRGAKRLPAGRPSKLGAQPPAKRARLLSKNIALNQPNAKSHGSGH